MRSIPETEYVPVIRTDFSDDDAWTSVTGLLRAPDPEFGMVPDVEFISDEAFRDATVEQLVGALAPGTLHPCLFVVDAKTIADDERSILVVDAQDEPGRTFRITPAQAYPVEANLSIANMDFEDFLNALDADGVHRGFA